MTNPHDDWGDDGGLGPALDAYAVAVLRADPERTGAVRARVMADARRRARAGRAVAPPPPRPRRWGISLPRFARAPLYAAASLLLVAAIGGGVLAGAGPGGPLYGARLWVEELFLPAAPAAREEAQLDRLEERLREVRAAAARGDVGALEAALEEYRATAEEAVAAAGDDAARRQHVAEQVGRHVAVLTGLGADLPTTAAEAIRAAIDRAEARIEAILEGRGPSGPGGTDAKPTPRPRPEATPKPTKTPPGRPTAAPEPTPEPTPKKTSPGKPTPEP